MPPERRHDASGDHDDMRVRMIHNRSHGPFRPHARDACPPPADVRRPVTSRRARLSEAIRGLGRPPQVRPPS